MPALPTRDDAWALLCEYTQNENLRKHALAVEACVRAYARKTGADEELWGLTALLHDFCLRRTRGIPHRLRAGQTRQKHLRGRARLGKAQAEGQSVRPWRQSRRCPQRRRRVRHPHRGAHRLLHRRHARRCGPAWPCANCKRTVTQLPACATAVSTNKGEST